jgi:hypothetical protein
MSIPLERNPVKRLRFQYLAPASKEDRRAVFDPIRYFQQIERFAASRSSILAGAGSVEPVSV